MKRIKTTDSEAVQAALDAAQVRATVRTLTAADVDYYAQEAEKHLERFGVPKIYRTGTIVSYCEQIHCNAYARKSKRAESTQINLIRGRGNTWYLGNVERVQIWPGKSAPRNILVIPTAVAVEAAIRNLNEKIRHF